MVESAAPRKESRSSQMPRNGMTTRATDTRYFCMSKMANVLDFVWQKESPRHTASKTTRNQKEVDMSCRATTKARLSRSRRRRCPLSLAFRGYGRHNPQGGKVLPITC